MASFDYILYCILSSYRRETVNKNMTPHEALLYRVTMSQRNKVSFKMCLSDLLFRSMKSLA